MARGTMHAASSGSDSGFATAYMEEDDVEGSGDVPVSSRLKAAILGYEKMRPFERNGK